MNQKLERYSKTFGPGILFACTAIGVSHLVQSTRAGADYGFALMGFVILAIILKYPFFEFGSRYANATKTSIIDGYEKIGKTALLFYFLLTIASMFVVTAAVGFVTAGFFENLFQIDFLGVWTIIILFAVCITILAIGRYTILDSLIKIIAVVLLVSTVAAFVLVLINGPVEQVPTFEAPEIFAAAGIFFLIALMGWMPAPVDISAWNSLWTLERIKQTKFNPLLRDTLLDFNLGYLMTGILAIFFVTLGAYIFYGSGEQLPNSGSLFAHKIVTLYTETIGQWSYLIIAASAFSVMFGTIIAVFDGYSRSLMRASELLFSKSKKPNTSRLRYVLFIVILATGSGIVAIQFVDKLKELVDFATTVSFLIAPIIAVFNLRLVTGRYLAKEMQPPSWLKVLSYAGIIFLSGFALFYIYTKFTV